MINRAPKRKVAATPAKPLASFIAKFDPAIGKLVDAACAALRKSMPTAVEFVYDNYNALAIGFGASADRPSEAVVSLAVYRRSGLCHSETPETAALHSRCQLRPDTVNGPSRP